MAHPVSLPQLLRRPEVEAAVGLSTATIYRLMSRNEFPRPIKVARRAVRWRADDIARYLQSRPTSNSQSIA